MNSSSRLNSSYKLKTRESIVESLKKSILASMRLESINKKRNNYFKTPLITKSIKSPENVYNSPSLCNSPNPRILPAFSFSSLPRFKNTIFEKFKSMI